MIFVLISLPIKINVLTNHLTYTPLMQHIICKIQKGIRAKEVAVARL